MKKRYQITLRTIYGSLTIDDIEAKTEDKAIEIAVKEYEDNNCFELKTSVVLHWLKEIANEALAISRVSFAKAEQLVCDHEWIHNTHSDTKYCRKGCDGFKIHEAN